MTKYRSEAIKRCEDLAEDARVRAEQLADLVMDFESELEMLIEKMKEYDSNKKIKKTIKTKKRKI